jgi:hypothetical protein
VVILQIAFTARLEGRQVVPIINTRARGCAIFAYDCKAARLDYLVFHNVPSALSASIYAGAVGISGSLFFDLSRFENPIFGSRILTAEEEYLLYQKQLYVGITSLSFPTGEVC